jgi:CYTH domain-containing protein
MTQKRIGKYACLEIERRYLLNKLPDDMNEDSSCWQIIDRYFPSTRLRLRSMKSITGNEVIYKLTQKYRSKNQEAYETTITNIYLSHAEYTLFEPLDARVIKKKRFPYITLNHKFSIDVFEERHQGLILAAIEFENKSECDEMDLPSFAIKDVTYDDFFSGGNLAFMTQEEFREGLAQYIDL